MWTVVGFDKSFVKQGEGGYEAYNLHCTRPYSPGVNCDGIKTKCFWFRAHEVSYIPRVGERVFVEVEQRGKYTVVVDIIRMEDFHG